MSPSLKDITGIQLFPGLSIRFLKENQVLPLKQEDGRIVLAMAVPENEELRAALEVALGKPVETGAGISRPVILEVIQTVYEPGSPMSRLVGDSETEELDLEAEETSEIGHLRDMAKEAPIIQLVNLLLLRAIQMGASDIHLEPFEENFRQVSQGRYSPRGRSPPRDCRRQCCPG